VVVAEDTGYPASTDAANAYRFHVADRTYHAAFAAAGATAAGVRLARYVVSNPAPVPVAIAVTLSGGWQAAESWSDLVEPMDTRIGYPSQIAAQTMGRYVVF